MAAAQTYSGPRFRTRYTVTPGGVPTEEYTGPRFSYTEEPKLTGKNDEMAGEQTYAGPRGPAMQPAEAEPAGRPRVVGQPNESAYEQPGDANRANLDALLANPATDQNGRGMSALMGLGGQIRPSDSIGNMIGQRIAGALNGLIRPQRDEEVAQEAEIKRRTGAEKLQRDTREQEADIKNKESMPVFRTEKQRQDEEKAKSGALDQQRRVLASQFNKVDEFDPDDPANADFVAEARRLNLPVFAKKKGDKATYKQDAKTGSWYVFKGDKSDTVKAPGSDDQLSTTSPQTMSAEQQAANRESREKIAQWLIGSRETIAAKSREIDQARLSMADDQFNKKYPGVGKSVSQDDIIRKAQALKMLPSEAAKIAVDQGYTIQD